MHEAKTQLSRLVGLAQKGDTVILAQHGTPVARLTGILPDAYPLASAFGHFRCQQTEPGRHFTIEELGDAIARGWAGER